MAAATDIKLLLLEKLEYSTPTAMLVRGVKVKFKDLVEGDNENSRLYAP